jgi:rRNA-processing protein FCF1
MPCKLMIDTSVFNHIYNHNLTSDIESFFRNNKGIEVYITTTQEEELNAITDACRKASILGLIRAISTKIVAASLGVAGLDDTSPHTFGYKGPRAGEVGVAEINGNNLDEIKKLRGSVKRNPLGEFAADVTILDTAVIEDMDYLVTSDKDMSDKLPERLEKVRTYPQNHPELKTKLVRDEDKDDLMKFLSSLI